MTYSEYRYLYPPRPEQMVMPIAWPRLRGCVQIKKNGHHVVVAVHGDRVITRTRHNRLPTWQHKLRLAVGSGWSVFCGELMPDRVVLFDVLVFKGRYLLGLDHIERQAVLDQLGRGRISDTVEVAINYEDPVEAARIAVQGEDEGLVFRMPGIGLQPCVTPGANTAGIYKWRRK